MRPPLGRGVWLAILTMLLSSLASIRADDGPHQITKLNGGYYLLHHVADDESQVPMLMMVKHAPAAIITFANDIAKVAKKNLQELKRFQEGDAAISFDQNPLPTIEQNVRDSIAADKEHQLLFGTSNSEFVRNFLVSQIEASGYALHLNQVLAEQETDPARAKTLQSMANDWGVIRARAYRLLRND